jgi:penicillin-binding protein 2
MMSAFRAGKQDATFPSYSDGYRPVKGYRPIVDATQKFIPPNTVVGACDGGCDEKNIALAYKVSSNQYFAQLANELGRERMKETAQLVGIAAVDTPEEASFQGFYADILNTSDKRIAGAIAPARSTMVTGSKITAFDFGLEGMGQGYAGQMTPFQMAMIAAIPANMNGNLMKPKIEADLPAQAFSNVLTPQQAAVVRDIMSSVVQEPGGTGVVVAGKLGGTGIRVGGKTGTAEKVVPLYDEKTGKRVTVTKKRKNAQTGEMEEYEEPQSFERTDSWFICIGPLGAEDSPEAPQFAIAVVVEAGGFGATTAAPIAANVILKLRELGLLGDKYKPKTQQQQQKPAKKKVEKKADKNLLDIFNQ